MRANLSPVGSTRVGLRTCRLFETSDLDEAREQISRVMQPHSLRLSGQSETSHAHMDFVTLVGMGLGTIAFGSASIDVPPLNDYHLLMFCLSGHGEIRTDTGIFPVDRFRGIACAPNQPVSGRFSSDCEQFVVRVDRQRFAAFTGQPDMRLSPAFDMRTARMRPWLAVLRSLVTCSTTLQLVQDHADLAADYEQLLLRLMLAGCEVAGAGERRPAAVRPASLRRALAFMEANAESAITLADLARAAGVPERTLYDAFRQCEGVSPMRYLRNLRLDRVRNRLVAGDDQVTEAALCEGFTHLSRFAQDYAARFGEQPSQTVRARLYQVLSNETRLSD